MRGDGPGDGLSDGVSDLEVFATGTTSVRAVREERVLVDHVHHTGELVRDAVQHARDFHARPGPRPGRVPIPTSSRRRGTRSDIVRPVMVEPLTAFAEALSGALFDRPIDGLAVDVPGDANGLRWRAVLDSGRHRYAATLSLFASPSMVVTVIELIPAGRCPTRSFVRNGIVAVDALAARLTAR